MWSYWPLVLPCLLLPAVSALSDRQQHPFAGTSEPTSRSDGRTRVNVSLAVMSRCPDSRECESVFSQVLQTKGIVHKISVEMGWIAELNRSEPLRTTCRHGELECVGNAHEVCMFEHLDFSTFFATLQCMNYEKFPGDIGKVALSRRCAETNNVDWWKSGVGQCIQGKNAQKDDGKRAAAREVLGKEGRRLMLENVKRTKERGEDQSCVIEIATTLKQVRRRCKINDGVWKGCDDGHTPADFVRVIEEEWQALQ